MKKLIYHPFVVQGWFIVGSGILAFLPFVFCLFIGQVIPELLPLCFFGILYCRFGYHRTFTTLSIDSEEFTVFENRKVTHFHRDELPYRYRFVDYKGFVSFVCAKQELDKKQIRKYRYQADLRMQIARNSVVVITINHDQKVYKEVEKILTSLLLEPQ